MSGNSNMIHIRMDNDLKNKASKALAAMGLTTSDAVRLLFHRIAVDQAFPLELKVPNVETQNSIEDAQAIIAKRRVRFASHDEMFAELDDKTQSD